MIQRASVIWCWLVCAAGLRAEASLHRIDSVEVGFRGVVEAGRWTPLSVQLSGPVGTVVTPKLTASDIEGRSVQLTGTPVTLTGEVTRTTMIYQHGPLETPVTIELTVDGRVIDQQTIHPSADRKTFETVSQMTDLVLCLGDSVAGFEQAAQIATEIRRTRPERVAPLIVQHYATDQLSAIPLQEKGWEAVDVVVISKDCEIPAELGTVLQTWVESGGRLVLMGGEQVASVGSPGLQPWIPFRLVGALNFRDITELNRAVPGSATLRLRDGSLKAVHWEADAAATLTRSLDGPIVIRTGFGLGTITAIAFDLNAPPFSKTTGDTNSVVWDSLPDLCRWLSGLLTIPRLEESAQRPQSDLNPTGVSDIQTQLVNTMDHFPEVARPSYWVVLAGVLLFIAVAGPIDYLVVHRLLKRPHWTWITLPIWIIAAMATGLTAAGRLTGDRDLTRQLDLVTWDTECGTAQLDSWLSIYSSRHHKFDVQVRPGPMTTGTTAESHIRWSGRPEPGFRGLYRKPSSNRGAPIEYASEPNHLRSLPIRQGGSSVIESKSQWAESPPVTFDLWDNGDGHLKGTFQHQLDGELVDWVLAYRSFAYMPSRDSAGVDLPLNREVEVNVGAAPSRLLADYLVGRGARSVQRSDRKSVDFVPTREGYDPLSRDLFLAMRSLTFHRIAETQSFVKLTNSTMQAEDLSRLVDCHRAVVFGRWRNSSYLDPDTPADDQHGPAEKLAADYSIDGHPNSPRYRECFIRWILPVRQPEAGTHPTPGKTGK